jgi:hypothetical protein
MLNHHRLYSIMLSTLAVVFAFSSGLLLFLADASAGGGVRTHLPEGSLPWVALINFAYAVAIIVTLCARRFNPESGRRLTRLLRTFSGRAWRNGSWDLWVVAGAQITEQ